MSDRHFQHSMWRVSLVGKSRRDMEMASGFHRWLFRVCLHVWCVCMCGVCVCVRRTGSCVCSICGVESDIYADN